MTVREEYSCYDDTRYTIYLLREDLSRIESLTIRYGFSLDLWDVAFISPKIVRINSRHEYEEDGHILDLIEAIKTDDSMAGNIAITYGRHYNFMFYRHSALEEHSIVIHFNSTEDYDSSIGFIEEYSENVMRFNKHVQIQNNVLFVLKTLNVMGIAYTTEIRPSVKQHDTKCIVEWKKFLGKV